MPKGARLSNERIRLLNDLDFFGDPYEDLWTKRYEELLEYYKEHGHSLVPVESETHKELGRWVHTQRKLHKKHIQGKLPNRTCFSKEKNRLLNEVEFVWEPYDAQWHAQFQDFEKYVKKHGQHPAPRENKRLYNWVRYQRQEYYKLGMWEKSSMTRERANLLRTVGFRF
jgi:hypothetical protein